MIFRSCIVTLFSKSDATWEWESGWEWESDQEWESD